jgi:hypothetical protein
MAFAQLTFRESLRDIEVCLRANQTPQSRELYFSPIQHFLNLSMEAPPECFV